MNVVKNDGFWDSGFGCQVSDVEKDVRGITKEGREEETSPKIEIPSIKKNGKSEIRIYRTEGRFK